MKRSIKFSTVPRGQFHQIRIRVSWNGQRTDFYTGISVPAEMWNASKERCISNKRNQNGICSSEINTSLQELEIKLQNIFTRFELEGKVPSISEVKTEYEKSINVNQQQNKSFESVLDRFILEQSKLNSWALGTAKSFNALRSRINHYKRNPDIKEIDTKEFLTGFTIFLHSEKYQNTTVNKTFSLLRWFLTWCKKNDYIEGAFSSFTQKAKTTQKEVIFLTWNELQDLYNCELKSKFLNDTRNVFCFCCFSGLRYSDIAKLEKKDIYSGKIHIVTQKTTDSITIELNNYTTEILKKYEGTETELALPVISNQKYNENLKVICRLAGIDTPQKRTYYIGSERIEETFPKYQLITTHTARKTFVVNALTLGIPAEVVMKWTGHSNFEAMKPYVAIVDSLKASEMNKFNK